MKTSQPRPTIVASDPPTETWLTQDEKILGKTHTSYSPRIIVKANDKKKARLESMRYVLSALDYENKGDSKTKLTPDPAVVMRYHRSSTSID